MMICYVPTGHRRRRLSRRRLPERTAKSLNDVHGKLGAIEGITIENHFNVELIMIFVDPTAIGVSDELRRMLATEPIVPAFMGASTIQDDDVRLYYDILPTLATLNHLLRYDELMNRLLGSEWGLSEKSVEAEDDILFGGEAGAVLILRRVCFEV